MYARTNAGWIVKISGKGVGTEITTIKNLRTYVKSKRKAGWGMESFHIKRTNDGILYYTLCIVKN